MQQEYIANVSGIQELSVMGFMEETISSEWQKAELLKAIGQQWHKRSHENRQSQNTTCL